MGISCVSKWFLFLNLAQNYKIKIKMYINDSIRIKTHVKTKYLKNAICSNMPTIVVQVATIARKKLLDKILSKASSSDACTH